MAVPNTNSFSLQHVIDEIAGGQTNLSECFAEANPAGFDSAYSGSKNSLLNFRNYKDVVVVNTLTVTPSSHSTNSDHGTLNLNIQSNTNWIVERESGADAFTNLPISGSGNAMVGLKYSENTGSGTRTVTISVTTTTPPQIWRYIGFTQTGY